MSHSELTRFYVQRICICNYEFRENDVYGISILEERMNRLAVPGSCALLAAGIAQRFWKKGWKDFGLLFG